ncbi:carotenoid biosynthesis protein [Williamsia soli]|uniref:carotenoid biosynthesis protein n=1 Tax=Williamsia soli TaxID=364929 RepID=UPI001F351ACE|nr:carotenoid biosynthesis protein [Williamsia soli]
MTSPDTRFALSAALLVVSIAAQITYPLVDGTTRDHVTVTVVLASAAAMVLHSAARLGTLRTVAMVAATAGVGWSAEIIGTATSFPFGAYEYATGRIGPSIADVPIVIGLAWTAGGYCIWWVSSFITTAPWFRVPLATAGMVGWDLYLDPQMVSAGLWTWEARDAGLPGIDQIPITNFLGWAGVAAVMFTLLSFIDRQPIVITWRSAITPIGWFTWTWLGSALAFLVFLDDPDLPAAVPYGLIGMGIVGVPAAICLFGAVGRGRLTPR